MANPQKENGFTAIANETMENLCKLRLSDYESRILHVIFRKTYGWDKKSDIISLSQFSKLTGILTQHVARTIKDLVHRNIISVNYITPQSVEYSFQKNYDLWDKKTQLDIALESQLLPEQVLPNEVLPNEVLPNEVLPIQDTGTTNLGNQVVPKQVDTITILQNNSTITNKNLRPKKIYSVEVCDLTDLLISLMLKNDQHTKTPIDKTKWYSEIDAINRLDHRDFDVIRQVINWSQSDSFWKTNILSASSLRNKFSQLLLKMNSRNNGHKQQQEQKPVQYSPNNPFWIAEQRQKELEKNGQSEETSSN